MARAGGGAPARRIRPVGPAAQEGAGLAADSAFFGTTSIGEGTGTADADVGGGGGAGGGVKNWSAPPSALRVAGGSGVAGGGNGGDNSATATTMVSGAFRVPRGGNAAAGAAAPSATAVFGSMSDGGGGVGDPSHQRTPATRVAARRPSVAGAEEEQQGFGGSSGPGSVASKAGRAVRAAGRHQQQPQLQPQRFDAGAVERQGGEAAGKRAEGAPMRMRAGVAASVVLDRREVLRQVRYSAKSV